MQNRGFNIQPKTAEDIQDSSTIQGIKDRIRRYALHDNLTMNVLRIADIHELSWEETVTLLAFQALCQRESLLDVQLDYILTNPNPMFILKTDT